MELLFGKSERQFAHNIGDVACWRLSAHQMQKLPWNGVKHQYRLVLQLAGRGSGVGRQLFLE